MIFWTKMSRNTKIIAALMAIVLIGLGLWLYQSQWKTKVAYYEVGTENVEKLIHLEAQTSPKESTWYSTAEGGFMTQMPFEKGTEVKENDVIFSIQPFDFSKKQAEVSGIMAQLSTEISTKVEASQQVALIDKLKKAQVGDLALQQAWSAHLSVYELFKTQMISSDSYKESLIQINDQMAAYMKDIDALMMQLAEIKSPEKSMSDLIGKLKSSWEPVTAMEAMLNAPAADGKTDETAAVSVQLLDSKAVKAGVISRITAEKGMYIPKGSPVLEVATPGLIKGTIDVPVDQLLDLKKGTKLRTKDKTDQVINGEITEIDKAITDQMQSDGSILKSVKVSFVLEPNSNIAFFSPISVSLVARSTENAIVIPKEVVYEKDGKYSVWYNQNGLLTEKTIEIDYEVNDLYVVKSGVKAGDKLVEDTKLHLGQKITF